ncbi:MAG: VOC family protein [Pseudomonadota bacterium]|jgi:predicted lactoylglutathione lyase|uniref:VOC family protein n=1 Tax=Curvibacter delicatus TaxID=80879 RepID=UPI00082A8A3D|nr:VOC family protein [Curvibacter delicatus]MEA3395353.1 VOC family protein [Pseudomonadota bacterium]
MNQQIYVNLPVRDLARSRAFFSALGYSFNPQFSNEQGACMVISDDIYVMLLTEPFCQTFTSKPLADARKTTEVLICLSCASRAEVDQLVAKARAAGGTVPRASQDHGFMYQHGFEDLDGHIWELAYMDMAACPATPAQA